MTTNIDLLRQRGINTGQVNQLPKALDTRIDYSNLRDLKSVNQSPRIPVATPAQPLSAQQQFFKDFKSPSAPATPTTSPAPSPSALSTAANGLSKALNSPLGKGAGALGLAAALANEASNLGSSLADVSNEVSGQGNRNRAANQSKRDSNARYEKALADRQKADAANSKGSGTQSGDPNYVPPFTGGQMEGVQYQAVLYIVRPNSTPLYWSGVYSSSPPLMSGFLSSYSNNFVNGSVSADARLIKTPPTRLGFDARYDLIGINGRVSAGFEDDWIVSIYGFRKNSDGADTGGDVPNPNPFTEPYATPVDFYKNRESTDPNNPYSPNYFPYFPTVKVGGKPDLQPDLQPDLSPKDRKDLRPFAEPEKPIFSPTPTPNPLPSPSPSPSPVPKLDRPNTGSSNTGSSSNTNSGTSQPYTAPVVDGGVFSPRPY